MHFRTKYAWEQVPICELCGSPDRRLFDRRFSDNVSITNMLCRRCGLVYQSPRIHSDSMREYYDHDYMLHIQGAEEVPEKELEIQRLRAGHFLSIFKQYGREVNRHLDLGSSTGQMLERFRSEFGCTSVGVEPIKAYREYAISHDLEMWPELPAAGNSNEDRFDLITAAHVLEHLPNPKLYLEKLLEQWLAPGGIMMLEVPNLFFHECFELSHLFSYHKGTLRSMLQQSGFEVIRILEHGFPYSRRFPLFLLAMARKALKRAAYGWPSSAFLLIRRRLGRASYLASASIHKLIRAGRKSSLEQLIETWVAQPDQRVDQDRE